MHEEHDNQTVERRWNLLLSGDGLLLVLDGGDTQMDTLPLNRLTDSFSVCLHFILHWGRPHTDNSLMWCSRHSARWLRRGKKCLIVIHLMVSHLRLSYSGTGRLSFIDGSRIMRVWKVHVSYKSSGAYLSWRITSSCVAGGRMASQGRHAYLVWEWGHCLSYIICWKCPNMKSDEAQERCSGKYFDFNVPKVFTAMHTWLWPTSVIQRNRNNVAQKVWEMREGEW